MHLDLTITAPDGSRAARITQATAGDAIWVSFGWINTVRTDPQVLANDPKAPPNRTEFRAAIGTRARSYATEFTARKAAQRWIDRV